jgi:hypothetical protein
MPGVVAPVVAARIELILIVGVVGLKIEDVLIVSYLLSRKDAIENLRLSKPSPHPSLGKRILLMAE